MSDPRIDVGYHLGRKKMSANDTQVGGSHYQGAAYQHWDYTIDVLENRYLEGQISKYVCRWRHKGKGIEDLHKAKHFIQKLVESHEAGLVKGFGVDPALGARRGIGKKIDVISELYRLNSYEHIVLASLSVWRNAADLKTVSGAMERLISKAPSLIEPIPPLAT